MKKINITRKECAKITSQYDIGELLSYRLFPKGKAHTNYLIKTNKGKFVCKIYNNKSEKEILCAVNILQKLKHDGFPCIRTLQTISDKSYFTIQDKIGILYVYVEGKQINKPNLNQFNETAITLATLHNITKNYRAQNCEKERVISKQECLLSAKENAQQLTNRDLARERLNWVVSVNNTIDFPVKLPSGIIHGDYSQENILFEDNKIVAVLDFDGSGHGPFILDIASMIYFWAWFKEPKRKLNLSKARDLLKEYQKTRKLIKAEKIRLYDALLLRVLVYLSWNINETTIEEEIDTNYYEYFKSLVEQVTSIGRTDFYKILFE